MKIVWPALVLLAVLAAALAWRAWPKNPPPIRIGVLHSLTGTMASSERPLVDAMRLAVEEINAGGGLLGRPVEMVVADGKSDNAVFAAEAERLITQEKVSVLFACWTSSCRKAVKPVVERHVNLMFYPVQYEGLEQSPNIYYTGSVPNQQIMPGTRWAVENLGKRAYLLGSDYIYPRIANRIVSDITDANGGEVLAERYLPLGEADFTAIIAELRTLKPDVVFNNLNGDSNLHFFRALFDAGLGNLAIVSFSLAEEQAKAIGAAAFHPRHYAVWDYFQSQDGDINRRFVAAFRARFGAQRVTSSPVVAAYVGVHLWAQGVRSAETVMPETVNSAVSRQSFSGPAGIVVVDRSSRHLWKSVQVGHARADGQFDRVWYLGDELRPRPFPDYRPQYEWNRAVENVKVLR